MITLNEHCTVLPARSVAVYVTVVVPRVNVAPGRCVDVSVAVQPPLTDGAVHETAAPHAPSDACLVIFEGQPVITGLLVASTITLNEHCELLPVWSVAVYVTTVVPSENTSPGKCVEAIVATQLSVTAGAVHEATAVLQEAPPA